MPILFLSCGILEDREGRVARNACIARSCGFDSYQVCHSDPDCGMGM